MRKSRFSIEQIVAAIKQTEMGMPQWRTYAASLASSRHCASSKSTARK